MKTVIVSASRRRRGCTLKDVAGGFGTSFRVGRSPMGRLLEAAKHRMVAVPNVTLAYLDAILSLHGATVRILHADEATDLPPADLYLVASSIVDCELERAIGRQARRRHRANVGYFGTFASTVPDFFADAADFVVTGEIERLAPSLARGEIPSGAVGAGFVDDLDLLPYPDWRQIDVSRCRYYPVALGPVLPVQGSRGCPYTCGYCPYLVNSVHRARSPENVAGEIDYLVRSYGVRGITFRDPTLTADRARAHRLAELLLARRPAVRWGIETRTDCLDRELLDLMHRAGLRSIEVGIDSADGATLEENGRRAIPHDQQEEIIRHCHRLGIRVIANYTLGLPNETLDGMRRTLRYAQAINTFAVQFTVTTPYPGTALYDQVADRIFDRQWEHYDGWSSVYRHPAVPPEALHRLREQAYVSYHARPRYLWRLLRSVLPS